MLSMNPNESDTSFGNCMKRHATNVRNRLRVPKKKPKKEKKRKTAKINPVYRILLDRDGTFRLKGRIGVMATRTELPNYTIIGWKCIKDRPLTASAMQAGEVLM